MGKLNESDFTSTTKRKYPYIKLSECNDTTPLVVSLLEEGDTPLVVTRDGVDYNPKEISLSALNINKLLRVHDNVVFVTKEESYIVTTCTEFLDLVIKLS